MTTNAHDTSPSAAPLYADARRWGKRLPTPLLPHACGCRAMRLSWRLAATTGISKSTFVPPGVGSAGRVLELCCRSPMRTDPVRRARQCAQGRRSSHPSSAATRGRTVVPLTQPLRGMHAWKLAILGNGRGRKSGRTRVTSCCSGEVRLADRRPRHTMKLGEAAEFDMPVPHWFGAAGDRPVEILSVVGKQGERIHVRPAPRRSSDGT